ncbi:Por secretion system C-terminal sorting domain-containing protein [Hymenobacter daecheongensis DSM 21074]|uniref:Por secretion system C-terminal sorting domain-containing protein n=1 Tax=Hymenobacter daecheongensis DSM 21074 TaxID=1121955 RepID=A0A1M6FC17_9BACT|nr:endonuclease [Hymenobacter daecheongensis]SHI95201.1 Por secretion system C-terminal sorting domain-containing protein [Hymenobacter daecheongensis DSM 21074]
MKHFFAWACVAVLSFGTAATAQVMPPAPAASLQGQALKTWLVQNWYDGKRVELSYNSARGKMYNYVDNFQGRVTCVYSGYQETVRIDSASTNPGVVSNINCEHSIPQSWFNEVVRMRSDIHHLFPTVIQWNSDRGSDPFAEIPDAQTLKWMRGNTSQTTIPTSNIDEYSEDTNSEFEPREDHKGNLARAAFYFYTMHQGQTFDPGKDVITALANLNTLYQWHLADPVDARERERNRRVAKSQGNFNPYVAYPDLVARAWGFQVVPTFSFSAATATIAEGNSGTSTYTATVSVTPAPTTALTVQVALDATSSTATSGQDFTFTSPQTLTFTAGQTTQTVTVTVNGDTQAEADETVVLALRNAASGAAIGGPATQELTITNDDGTPPSVRFAAATASLPEGNSGTTTYTVNVTAASIPVGGFSVPVTVETAGTTADAADYTLSTSTLTFAAGQSSQAVTLTVNGDVTPEPNETVRLRLGTPSNAAVLVVTPATHTLTILNDDQAPAGSPCSDLYFSEYAESSTGNTKYVEIYNPTANAISLAGLRVDLFPNGATAPTATAALTGTLNPGAVYVIANAGSVASVLAKANMTSNITFFNGDDALALFDGTDTLDVIGVIGQQPAATGWVIPGGGTTTNNTLVRKPTAGRGNTRWAQAAAEWQTLGTDVFTNVGLYTSTACVVTATTKAAPLGTGLEVYPNPTAAAFQVRVPGLRGRHEAEIGLYNALGQQVLTQRQPLGGAEAATLRVQQLPAGLYSVRVTVDGVRYTSRVVVQP